jgi:Fic family protein
MTGRTLIRHCALQIRFANLPKPCYPSIVSNRQSDNEADITAEDRDETPDLIEPLVFSENARQRGELVDLAFELAQKSAGLKRALPASMRAPLANLVRAMNCYHSNLIEGRDTHPVDIERALHRDYRSDPKKRDLQKEASAHIAVQPWIDQGGVQGRALTINSIQEIHRRFCNNLQEALLFVEDRQTRERVTVVPGIFDIPASCRISPDAHKA